MGSASIGPPLVRPAAQGDWVSRNWKWFVPVLVAIVLLCILGLIYSVFGLLRSSEPYQHGLQVALNDPRTTQLLGAPVKSNWLFTGNVQSGLGGSGSAEFAIPMHGPSRQGTLYIEATKTKGVWSYKILRLRINGANEEIDFLRRPTAPSSSA